MFEVINVVALMCCGVLVAVDVMAEERNSPVDTGEDGDGNQETKATPASGLVETFTTEDLKGLDTVSQLSTDEPDGLTPGTKKKKKFSYNKIIQDGKSLNVSW